MTVYNTKRRAVPWGSGEEFNFRYQSDYVTQGNMWGHDIYYVLQVVSENCRHGIVISANNTCIVCFSKYCYALLLHGSFVILLQSSILAGSEMFKTFTESYQMTYIILKHTIKENADMNSVTTPS